MPARSVYTENELAARIAAGDEAAFRQLFSIYKDVVYSAACRWLGSPERSEDIVQDIFLKLWQNRSGLTGVENLKVYILVATKNQVFNVFKQNTRAAIAMKHINPNPGTDSTNEEVDYKETYSLLQLAVARLPEQQRKVFVLGKLEGYKLQEIASDLDISIVTVNKHMALAVRSVKDYLLANDEGLKLSLIAFLLHQV